MGYYVRRDIEQTQENRYYRKFSRNQQIDRQILDLNFKIDSIIGELELTKNKEDAKKDKKS